MNDIVSLFVEKYHNEFFHYTNELSDACTALMNEWKNTDLSSDSILYSVVRRISRETMVTARWIDKLASKFVNLVSAVHSSEGKRMALTIENAEWLDRPSIRVLYRIQKLLSPSLFSIAWFFNGNPLKYTNTDTPFDDMFGSIKQTRFQIFSKLASDFNPTVVQIYSNEIDYKLESQVVV